MDDRIVIKGVIDEDFVNYKEPTMTIMFPKCSMKCNKECGEEVCQNGTLLEDPDIMIDTNYLCERYIDNPITSAICCQGMEPFDSFEDLESFIWTLRYKYECGDDVVIYTGYEKDEIEYWVNRLADFKNIIVKFGRYIPDEEEHYDDILGINLASDNQYAERIS